MLIKILIVILQAIITINCFSQDNSVFHLEEKIIFKTKDGKKDAIIGTLQDIAIDKDGNIFVLDSFDHDIKKVTIQLPLSSLKKVKKVLTSQE